MNPFEKLNDFKATPEFDKLDKSPDSVLSPQKQTNKLKEKIQTVSEKIAQLKQEISIATEDDFKTPPGYVLEKSLELQTTENELAELKKKVDNMTDMSDQYEGMLNNVNSDASKN